MEDNLEKDSINVKKALKKTTEEQDKEENDSPVETENMNIPEEDDPLPSGTPIDIQYRLNYRVHCTQNRFFRPDTIQ